MLIEKLNPWLTLISNIGIVLGLVFLALEIRQNAEDTRFAVVSANRMQRIETSRSNRDSPYIYPILIKDRKGESLTEEEASRLNAHHSMNWAVAYYEWFQREIDMAGSFLNSDEAQMTNLLRRPSARQWWIDFGEIIYSPEFAHYVDEWMNRVPVPELD